MDEVDRLYNEWREEQRIQAERMCRSWMNNYKNYNQIPDYIKTSLVLETSKALNEFIENNKNDLCSNETFRRIKYVEEELEKRANKRSELAAKVREAHEQNV